MEDGVAIAICLEESIISLTAKYFWPIKAKREVGRIDYVAIKDTKRSVWRENDVFLE
ncbi:MAG: hypothetical protein IKH16_05710 [Selenomonadaceae bacterium]|nr:hypothetical protein [Selenomonadaceae bacterium]MBR4694447.1 hypothetical protein [Selenomonadaceae bacterium]